MTYRMLAYLGGPDFIPTRVEAMQFLACRQPPPDVPLAEWEAMDDATREERQWERFLELQASRVEEDRRLVNTIVAVPNALEDLAGLYNHNLLHRPIMKTHGTLIVEGFWSQARWWLKRARKASKDPNTYVELERMIPDLRQQPRPRWHHPEDGPIKRDALWFLDEKPWVKRAPCSTNDPL